jgi:hypothetical protein
VGTAALLGLPNLARAPEVRLTATASAPPEGAYWHTRALWKNTHHRQLGSGANRYWVEEQQLSERWTAPDGSSWFGSRTPGAYPKSAADRKAWRRDGSPARWTRAANGQTVKLSTEPDKGHVTPGREKKAFFLGGQYLTYDELQRLPADPDALKSWLSEAARVSREIAVDRAVTWTLPALLHELPAPKEVRTAAYRALLTMPGVRSGGRTKDDVGRTGAVLTIEEETGQNDEVTIELIIDTDTMLLLSRRQTAMVDGKLFPNKSSTQTVLQAGWTEAEPAVPALP